jgi:hypothetical protein
MFSLPAANWFRLLVWMAIGLLIYFFYGRKHSVMTVGAGAALQKELSEHGTGGAYVRE